MEPEGIRRDYFDIFKSAVQMQFVNIDSWAHSKLLEIAAFVGVYFPRILSTVSQGLVTDVGTQVNQNI
jgi:hypothetical protein